MLDSAIEAHRVVLAARRPGHPDRAERLFHLGNTLIDRYALVGDRAALDEGIVYLLGRRRRLALSQPTYGDSRL